jgi:hypothetical protein
MLPIKVSSAGGKSEQSELRYRMLSDGRDSRSARTRYDAEGVWRSLWE